MSDLIEGGFYEPKNKDDKSVYLMVTYRGAKIWLQWPEESVADLNTVVLNLPIFIKSALQERALYQEVQNMDTELEELLGEAE